MGTEANSQEVIANLNQRLEKAREIFKEQRAKIEELTAELDKVKASKVEVNVKESQSDYDKLKADYDELSNLVSTLNSVIDEKTEEISGLEATTASYKPKLKEKDFKIDELTAELKKVKSENEVTKDAVETYKAEISSLMKLKENSENYANELNTLKVQYAELEKNSKAAVEDLTKRLDICTETIHKYEDTIKNLKGTVSDGMSKVQAEMNVMTKRFGETIPNFEIFS